MNQFSKYFWIVVALVCCMHGAFDSDVVFADEVVIGNNTASGFELGDFNCVPCSEQVTTALALGLLDTDNQGEVSAGQLWQFFHEQGIDSLDRITLCLDVDRLDDQTAFDLRSIELQIEDPQQKGKYLTQVSMGDNSLLVPGYHTSAYKPEAKLEIALGYDFMERFSASSTEKIQLDFSSNDELKSNAKFSIEGAGNVFTKLNVILLVGFGLFWIVVFFVLNRLTHPDIENASGSSADVSPNTASNHSGSVAG